ncbi:DUF2238 domain-containing protein [Thermoactinomyces sp. DSM 45892]|uniref:DUF2238 domain-containing protein n=1 Tax=Thermoactinomyces sp. DSM 45892 TaxID=1882753 RepID=UPI000894B26C|nr:DUF2238 domain-containing protein [Thermoactinomyces sp. DSM 45892]SDY76115.1 putative membrane protein [Thermoactinomyces sp. DSM 45892]
MNRKWLLGIMICILAGVLIWSGIHPVKRSLWFFEAGPAILLVLVLLITYRRFPLTTLTYTITFISCIIMMIGAHYTYAEVPLFKKITETFHFSRNHFDRVGHFFFGMIVAAFIREIAIRTINIQKEKLLPIWVLCITLALSAAYELLEFLIGSLFTEDVQEFLGYQGDIFDSHWDMVMALFGGIALLWFSKWQDRQISSVTGKMNEKGG